MFTMILCASLAVGGSDSVANIRQHLIKQIKKEYKVTRADAWTIADAVVRSSKRYDVPMEMILSVIAAESAFNKNAISDKGAVGLMQVMPSTGEYIAKRIRPGEYVLDDIRTNIRFGTWYLKHMHNKYKDWSLAVRAYNCGPGRTDKVLAGKYDYPQETKEYHDKVMATALIIQMAMPYVMEENDNTTGQTNTENQTNGLLVARASVP